MEPHMWWEGGFRWMWIFPFTFMVLMMLFMGLCVFWFFRRSGCPMCGWWNTPRTKDLEAPRQILDRRYASGEITKEQYEGIMQDLERRKSQ
jgi:putative membrane protein